MPTGQAPPTDRLPTPRTGDTASRRVGGAGRVWRVTRRATFAELRRGRRGRAGPCTVSWVPGQADEPPKVAYAIGRRVGPAVVRNRLRRRLRTIVRDLAADLPPGAYLIGMGPGAALSSYNELRTMVPRAIAQATTSRSSRSTGARP